MYLLFICPTRKFRIGGEEMLGRNMVAGSGFEPLTFWV